ncbi:ANTIGENIC HEAT-STABLE PROTEIN [Salix koriyanagi]|uniref:ANTIGENIC HEAT-STABLE PROTEIN n=1 Tax=Salix koriyanagi TaxID=2511006 RepID=A0A9Q0VY02_9ROSI|nr:ANTIGENIC HEAT-STABLE PROTEIN [Salix koriyanagi]
MESASTSSSTSIITPEDVLESLMNDGTIDALRLKIINQLKANEELKNTAIRMAEQSKVLNTPGAEKQTKRELFDALRQELEAPVLEKASRSVWELILDGNGLGKEISETVERVYCRLSGQEPPLFPQPNAETQPDKGCKGREEKEEESDSQKEKSSSNSKKRSRREMSMEVGANEVANQTANEVAGKSVDLPPAQEGANKSPPSTSKT